MGALTAALVAPPPFPEAAARGRGQPVIVVPGFCSPEFSTARLRAFLNQQGFGAQSWDCGVNLGPIRPALVRFEQLVIKTAEDCGRPIALVGISLGGTLAREMAKFRPGHVARVVTLASPIRLPVVTPLAPLAHAASALWDAGAYDQLARIAEPPPVPVTAIVSPDDGVVDWRVCVPDSSPHVETVMVNGAHMTIGSNPEAQRIVAARLALV